MRIRNIGSLAVVPPGPLAGPAMAGVAEITHAAIEVHEGRLAWFGRETDAPPPEAETIDAGGGCVIPGLIDCHTHIPFCGNRAGEFVRRLAGESYLSIMQAGGGIRVTTAAVRAASEDQLVEENLPKLTRMLAGGVTTCECKSGYGLTVDDEFKQLRATRRLAAMQPIELVPTYLGAHALPAEYEGRADAFIDEIANEAVFERLRDQKLARFCDVFCDRGAFDVSQSRRVLERAAAHGLRAKLHADELAQIGAAFIGDAGVDVEGHRFHEQVDVAP